jgi:hypothetical protein
MHRMNAMSRLPILLVGILALAALLVPDGAAQNPPTLGLVAGSVQEAVQRGAPGTEQNLYGFEGGSVVKASSVYYWFPSEMWTAPRYVGMRLALWESSDALHWVRVSTLWQSTGDTVSPSDVRAALWSQEVVWDGSRWQNFHIGYNALGAANLWGRPFREQSVASSPVGPFEDHGWVPVAWTKGWEGNQGTDSFYPFQVGGSWYALFGSHGGSCPWCVGVAQSSSGLDGTWTEVAGPLSNVEPTFLENPIVARVGTGYVAVYDADDSTPNIGVMTSPDGINWTRGTPLNMGLGAGWIVRTPLSLVPESDGSFTMMFNAAGPDGFEDLFQARVSVG